MATATLDIRVVSQDVEKAIKRLDDLERQGKSTERGMGGLTFATTGMASAMAALSAAATMSVRSNMRFEKSLSDLSAITGATGKQLEYLKAQAADIGSTTSLSASEAATAFKLIASAKPDLLESSTALNAVTRAAVTLAEAAGTTLPEAANTLGSALNQFGADADQATRFINVLAAGSKFGAAEVAEVAESLKVSGVSAAGAKIPFEQLNASIQSLSTVSIKGSEAGTALRNIILKLETDANDRLKPSINGLNGALKNLADMNEDAAALTKRFGLENVNAAQALLANVDNLDDLTSKLTGTNTALEQAATRTDNLDGDMKNLSSAVESLALVIGDTLNPTVRDMTQLFADGARGAANFLDSLRDAPSTAAGATFALHAIYEEMNDLQEKAKNLREEGSGLFGPNSLDIKKAEDYEKQIASLRVRASELQETIAQFQGKPIPGSTTPAEKKKDETAVKTPVKTKSPEEIAAEAAASAALARSYDAKIAALARTQAAEQADYESRLSAAGEFNARIAALNYTAEQQAANDRGLRMVENQTLLNNSLISQEQYEFNLTAIKQRYSDERTRIEEEEADKRKRVQDEAANAVLQHTQASLSITTDMLANAGKETNDAYKIMMAIQKAAAIPSILVSTEVAAMKAMELGPYAGPVAAGAVRAMGYASAGIAAGQTFAGLFDNGGNIPSGQWGIVGERGPEIVQGPANVTSRKKTAAMAASAASGGNGGGMVVQITQNITGNGDQALAEVVDRATKNAMTEVQRDFATNGRLRRTGGF